MKDKQTPGIYWGDYESVSKVDKAHFEDFKRQSPREIEEACRDQDGRLQHIINAEHFDLDFLTTLCDTAKAARRIDDGNREFLGKLLRGRGSINFFKQPSSRTWSSFTRAAGILGMQTVDIKDVSTSSEVKGESEKDSLRTLSSYGDALVCRHPSDEYDLFGLWVQKSSGREIPFINAGSGTKRHPTQGILDYYTIKESFNGNIDGRVIAFVGDCLRGRTVHSLAKILALHKNITAYFVAPENLQIDLETERYIEDRGVMVHKETESLRRVVPLADAIYMTRVQSEHGGSGDYNEIFKFTMNSLDSMCDGAILMHPGPKRDEIDPEIDYLNSDQRVMYWRQQRNGMWTRVALLAHVLGVDDKIRETYKEYTKIGVDR